MKSTFTYASLLILALAGYLFAGKMGLLAHKDPAEMDTTSYLQASYQIKQTGGILAHVSNCLNGIYREATQHPLYLLYLSPAAERNVQFFVRAKILTYRLGFIFLILFFFVMRKIFPLPAVILGICLILLNATFIHMTTMVACESMLALFFILFWGFCVLGFKHSSYWAAAGFFAGLTFLTKSVGILLLPIFFLTAIIYHRKNVKTLMTNKYFLSFFLIFFITAGPIIIRNVKAYGTPLYSNSSAVLWMDQWNDYFVDGQGHRPTALSYLKTHSAAQIAGTFFKGLFVRDAKMIMDGLKPLPFWNRDMNLKALQGFYEKTVSWQWPWAFILSALFAAGLWQRRKSPESLLTGVTFAVFLCFVGWFSKVFPGTPPTRLLYPLLFILLIFASDFVVSKIKNEKILISFFTVFLSSYLFFIASRPDVRAADISNSYAFGKIQAIQMIWVRDHVREGEKILVNSLFVSNLFYFRDGIKAEVLQWPSVGSMQQAESFIKIHEVNYAILDLSTVLYNFIAFGEYFNVGPKVGLNLKKPLPAFFKPIPKDPRIPPLYELYSF